MRSTIMSLVAVAMSAMSTMAQDQNWTVPKFQGDGANPTHTPLELEVIKAGVPYNFTWTPTTAGTVTLLWLEDAPKNATPVWAMVQKMENTGFLLYTPPKSLKPAPSGYAYMVVADSNGEFQWSPQFGVSNPDYVASSTSSSVVSSTTSTEVSTSTSISSISTTSSHSSGAYTDSTTSTSSSSKASSTSTVVVTTTSTHSTESSTKSSSSATTTSTKSTTLSTTTSTEPTTLSTTTSPVNTKTSTEPATTSPASIKTSTSSSSTSTSSTSSTVPPEHTGAGSLNSAKAGMALIVAVAGLVVAPF